METIFPVNQKYLKITQSCNKWFKWNTVYCIVCFQIKGICVNWIISKVLPRLPHVCLNTVKLKGCSWTVKSLFLYFNIIFRAVWPDVIQAALFKTSDQAKQPPTQEAELCTWIGNDSPLSEPNGVLLSVVVRPPPSLLRVALEMWESCRGCVCFSPDVTSPRIKGVSAADVPVCTLLMGRLRGYPPGVLLDILFGRVVL